MGSCGWFPLQYDEIVAWVEQHRGTLPTTLAELSAFPVAFRNVIVNTAAPRQRTRFWEEHLRSFLEPHSPLTAEQQAFIAETIPRLASIFENPPETRQSQMHALEERMRGVFTRQQCAAIFGRVGPPEPPEGLPLPAGTRLTSVD